MYKEENVLKAFNIIYEHIICIQMLEGCDWVDASEEKNVLSLKMGI